MGGEVDAHLGEIEAGLPVDLVLVLGNNWDGPSRSGVELNSPRDDCVIRLVEFVCCQCFIVHSAYDAVIILEDLHIHKLEDIRLIVIEDNTPHLDGAVTDETIILFLEGTLRLLVVLPVGCGPGVGAKTGKGSVSVKENISVRSLVANLLSDSCGIHKDVRECHSSGT